MGATRRKGAAERNGERNSSIYPDREDERKKERTRAISDYLRQPERERAIVSLHPIVKTRRGICAFTGWT